MQDAEAVARRFHEVYEALAPSFAWKTQKASAVAWDDLPDNQRKLMLAVVRLTLPELPDTQRGQLIEAERNRWQSKVGVLLILIETMGSKDLREAAIRTVNTSQFTGNIDDPYADIASLAAQEHLRMGLAAGIIEPGPNAMDWMKSDADADADTNSSEEA